MKIGKAQPSVPSEAGFPWVVTVAWQVGITWSAGFHWSVGFPWSIVPEFNSEGTAEGNPGKMDPAEEETCKVYARPNFFTPCQYPRITPRMLVSMTLVTRIMACRWSGIRQN
ncbi:MAG: hypothetical protein J6032_05510 [Bacteroidales bacterium]|nr:hypothetical protein [Bacteroidales bacterium]